MGKLTDKCEQGVEVGPLVKEMTQEAINLFEGSAGQTGPSQFTDDETARELLRRHFGAEAFNRTGVVDLRFLRPVRPGHTLTLKGTVSEVTREPNGSRVSVDIEVTNQDGNVAGVGTGSVIVPTAYLSPEL